MNRNISLHESYRDSEAVEAGSDRAFGCTVGTILMVIGAAKTVMAGSVALVASLIFAVGGVLLLLGIVAPARLSLLNRLWLKLGAAISTVVNPIVLAVLFFAAVTPMAMIMRLAGKRPLRLAFDRTAASYWIAREPPPPRPSTMRQQF